MKISNLLYLLLFSTLIFAEQISQNQLDKQEIILLKEKIKKLESELLNYKKVKPLSGIKIPQLDEVKFKKTVKKQKFILDAKIPTILSAYYIAKFQPEEQLVLKLKKNGFQILAKDKILDNKFVLSITNDELRKTNSFLASLHLLVNNEKKEIRVQNPNYFGAAYLQKNFKYGQFEKTLVSLQNVLGEMFATSDKLKFSELPEYHFMLGMPHFEDTIIVGRGNYLLHNLGNLEFRKHISYQIKLPNGATLVGHKLKISTYEYLEKISAKNNALIFPYEVIISDQKAYMLSPKFYLALSLPMLSMTDFMKIASAPKEIEKEIKKIYRKIDKDISVK